MRVVLQRVADASVRVGDDAVGAIGRGLVVLLAAGAEDTDDDVAYIVDKTLDLRIFPDSEGRFDRSVRDIGGDLLVVSQFTLYGDTRKGRRPSFTAAAPPDAATRVFDDAVARFRRSGLRVETGVFRAMMQVSLVNDGPVTLWLDSAERHRPRRG